jgi:hypothetical protein
MAGTLTGTISVIVKEVLAIYGTPESCSDDRFHRVLNFVLEQMQRMPWLPRLAIKILTLCFTVSSFLHNGFAFLAGGSAADAYRKRIQAWSCSSLRPCRDLVKFYAAMVVLSLYSDSNALDREGL